MRLGLALALLAILAGPVIAQFPPAGGQRASQDADLTKQKDDGTVEAPTGEAQLQQLRHAMTRLPLSAALATILALRPRRRGTPPRQTSVVQTQIILSVVGALVMLVVGSSLARAFGIVGAAGLVRYRAKVSDPKDAGVMLSTLGIGLASGVGIWMIALFATGFILAVLWVIESFEPKAKQEFSLKVKAKHPNTLKPKLEEFLAKSHLSFDLRTAAEDELVYEVKLPIEKKTEHLSEVILTLDPQNTSAVEWDQKKSKS
jgi:uncharacterized membrane protein YhiD involved in acid resistance